MPGTDNEQENRVVADIIKAAGLDTVDDNAQEEDLEETGLEADGLEGEELEEDGYSEEPDPFKGKYKTPEEQIKAHLEAERKLSEQGNIIKDLNGKVENLFKTLGVNDDIDLKVNKIDTDLQTKRDAAFQRAYNQAYAAVEAGEITPEVAIAELSKYEVQLDFYKDEKRKQEIKKINDMTLASLGETHKDYINIPSIQKASSYFVRKAIDAGEIIDPKETAQMFKFGQEIFKEGYMAAMKQQKKAGQEKEGAGNVKQKLKSVVTGTKGNPSGKNLTKITPAQMSGLIREGKVSDADYNVWADAVGYVR